jgi:hypothetical protein
LRGRPPGGRLRVSGASGPGRPFQVMGWRRSAGSTGTLKSARASRDSDPRRQVVCVDLHPLGLARSPAAYGAALRAACDE